MGTHWEPQFSVLPPLGEMYMQALIGTSWGCTPIWNRWLQKRVGITCTIRLRLNSFEPSSPELEATIFNCILTKCYRNKTTINATNLDTNARLFIPDQTQRIIIFLWSEICLFQWKDLFISTVLSNLQHFIRDALPLQNHTTGSDTSCYNLWAFVPQYRWWVQMATVREKLLPHIKASILAFHHRQSGH